MIKLEKVTSEKWLEGLLNGNLCFQDGNPKIVYKMNNNGDVLCDNKIHVEREDVEEWVNLLNDGFREFYVLNGK